MLMRLGQEWVSVMLRLPRRIMFTAAVIACLMGGAALAHHGVTGRYDVSRPIVLSGTITQATFSPPHPVLSVRVDAAEIPEIEADRPSQLKARPVLRPEDVGMVREVELSPVQMFFQLGSRVSSGDRVTVLALRNCLPPHQLRSFWIRLPDCQVVAHEGDWARAVEGCGDERKVLEEISFLHAVDVLYTD